MRDLPEETMAEDVPVPILHGHMHAHGRDLLWWGGTVGVGAGVEPLDSSSKSSPTALDTARDRREGSREKRLMFSSSSRCDSAAAETWRIEGDGGDDNHLRLGYHHGETGGCHASVGVV